MNKKILIILGIYCCCIGAKSQSLYFPPISGSAWDTLSPQTLNWCQPKIDSFYNFLDSNNTKAFILLKDGKIVLEKYFGTHTSSTPWQWASAGKTITSFMVGIAQQENYLSITDTTSTYLGQGWTSCTPVQENKITIKDQLTMTSGLNDGVPDPNCTLDTCLIYEADAGTRWSYHNAPYTLLDSVLATATGSTLNAYTTQKLKNPIGMTGAFLPFGFNSVYISNARSMARFGLLNLNRGNWNGNQILTDTSYYNQMVNTSQNLNLSYGYLWWLNGKSSFMAPGTQFVFNGNLSPSAPSDMFAAMGKDGQFLTIVPSQNLVWVRMGNSSDGLPVPFIFYDAIWQQINTLSCGPLAVEEDVKIDGFIQLFPNPGSDVLHIASDYPMSRIEFLNVYGSVAQSTICNEKVHSIAVGNLAKGLYFVKVLLLNGNTWTGKFLKE